MENIIPWQAILTSPNSAWAVVFIILLIYVMQQNGKREERLTGIIENTLKEMTNTLSTLNNKVCNIEDSIEKYEEERRHD
jgi:uncharacterized protein YoxC